jgi:hypothetical protein
MFKQLCTLVVILSLSGCSAYQNANRQKSCNKIIDSYSKLIRWQGPESAALSIVSTEQKETFNQEVESFRKRGVSVVDYRIRAKQCLADKKQAEATVEFDYYVLPDSRVKTVIDRQTWIYQEETAKEIEGWKLTSPLPNFN